MRSIDTASFVALRRLGRAVFFLAALSLAASAAYAGTIVPPRDLGALARASETVVLARAGASTAVVRGGMILTQTAFTAVEGVAGPLDAGTAFVTETPGGVAGGYGWQVAGSPEFEAGTVYLLFLERAGSAWRPRVLSYGLLEQTTGPGGQRLLTHLAETHALDLLKRPDGTQPEPVGTYFAQDLVDHLRAVAARQADWDAEAVRAPLALHPSTHDDDGAGKSSAIPEPCVFISNSGVPIRWKTFGDGGTVNIFAEENGDADLGGGGLDFVRDGLDAWNDSPGVTIDYHWAGPTPYTPDCSDGSAAPNNLAADQGLVQFNDPCDQIPDLSASCTGTLAFGGAYFFADPATRHTHRDLEWNTNVVAYVVVNNGVGGCISSSDYRIVMTHELGHSLGFGHIDPSDGAALMNPSCCVDLTEIDRTCAAFAYSGDVLPGVPGPAVPLRPLDAAEEQPLTPTLEWEATPEADGYDVEIALDALFTDVVYAESAVPGTTLPAGPLAPNTQYYWHVRARNAIGPGPWSDRFRFTTEVVPPGAAVLSSPADGAVDQPASPTVAWERVLGADRYHLQVARDEAFALLVFDRDDVTGQQHEIGPLDPETTFFWRVRATNDAGPGAWSAPWRLTTLPLPPAALALRSPDDGADDLSITPVLEWQRDPTADTFHLQVALDDAFATLVADEEGLTSTQQAVGPLLGSRTYHWRVRGVNRAGGGPWTARRFTTRLTAPGAVVLAAPTDGRRARPATLDLTWQPEPQAETYALQLARDDAFTDILQTTDGLTDTRLSVGPLTGNAAYHWRVRASNAIGDGPWSPAWTFSTAITAPGAVIPLAPEDDAEGLPASVLLQWQADPNARTYHAQVARDDAFADLVVDAPGLTEPQHQTAPLPADARYAWRVRGVGVLGTGPWSGVRHFTVAVGTSTEAPAEAAPEAFRLYPNYPNPFNPRTTLRFDVPARAHVSLVVYDVLGRAVEVLVDEMLPAGRHEAAWEAGNLPSGLYLARLHAGAFTQTRQLTLLK